MESLGGSLFSEEGKGEFRSAAVQADTLLAAARTSAETVDAAVLRGIIHVLRGEPVPAVSLLERALKALPDDANRTALGLSVVLLATHQRYNAFPDGNGVAAVDGSARWQVGRDLVPLDARWQQAMQGVTDPAAQFKARLNYNVLAAQQTLRFVIEGTRFTPSPQPRDQLLARAVEPAAWLRQTAITAQVPAVAAFADWTAPDLHRRAGDLTRAHDLLTGARTQYLTAGDQAGEALCLMTAADWACAPFSSPLVWNLADLDSTSASSALSVQAEAEEFTAATDVSYDATEALYRMAAVPRGLGAIQLRRGYLAMLRDDWAGAASHAIAARDGLADCGDYRRATWRRPTC